jgi:hypothetical protein
MKRALIISVTVAVVVALAMPATSPAKPASFALWWARFSAHVQRDVTRISSVCQHRYGRNDVKLGACFVRAERISLRAERAAWEKQVERISHGQGRRCRKAIGRYRSATRKAARANLIYLDSHRHAGLAQIGRDLNGQPFATLKSATFKAKANAVRICG